MARLRPSAAERWMNCTASVRLIESLPQSEQPVSLAAAEGTVAHQIAEYALSGANPECVGTEYNVSGHRVMYTPEMADAVASYIKHCKALRDKALWGGAEMRLERLKRIDPEIEGTADFVAVVDNVLHVVDFKYGAGVYVDETDNKQLKLYALGALMEANHSGLSPTTVVVTVIQPRYEGAEPVRAEVFPALALMDFAADVQEAAATTRKSKAPFRAGPWCKKTFCPAAAHCPELEKQQAMVVSKQFDPVSLLPSQMGRALEACELAEQRIKAIREAAYAAATAGHEVPGYKLVDKRPTRRWTEDEVAVANWILKEFDVDPFEYRLRSPASIEKELKGQAKKNFKASDKVAAVSSGATLVKGTDPRKPVSKVVKAEEFAKITGPVAKPESEEPPSEFTIV